jgi:redox-sensitive bicupin YhaK (pirin superfamily)
MHGIQAWVALPQQDEETDPVFFHHGVEDLPAFEEGGAWARLIAGHAFGVTAKVRTHSPMFYLHWELGSGSRASLPVDHAERAVFVASGAVAVDGNRLGPGQMAVLAANEEGTLQALEPSTVMALGGEPLGQRFIEWNFVSSSQERIEQAKADWRAGRMKLPDLDADEFIPFPGDPQPVGPMSQFARR